MIMENQDKGTIKQDMGSRVENRRNRTRVSCASKDVLPPAVAGCLGLMDLFATPFSITFDDPEADTTSATPIDADGGTGSACVVT